MKAVLLIVFASWFYPTEQQSSCRTSEMELCVIPSMLNAKNVLMPKNVSTIINNCKICSNGWKCADNYFSKCLSDNHRMVAELVTRSQRKIFQEYCDPTSKLRAEYDKHLHCVSDAVALTLQTCTDNLENVIHMIAGDDAEDRVSSGCCYFRRFYNCLERNVIKFCGKGSFNPIKDTINIYHFDTINSVCKFYDPEDEICTDYLNREVPAPSDSASYLARLIVRYLRSLQ